MLVIGRATNQQLRIDGDIIITVLNIDGGQVRLRVCAPTGTSVLRGEHYERKKSYMKRVGLALS